MSGLNSTSRARSIEEFQTLVAKADYHAPFVTRDGTEYKRSYRRFGSRNKKPFSPDRSNFFHWPSVCAKRSAIA